MRIHIPAETAIGARLLLLLLLSFGDEGHPAARIAAKMACSGAQIGSRLEAACPKHNLARNF